jgi:hypothetical protein
MQTQNKLAISLGLFLFTYLILYFDKLSKSNSNVREDRYRKKSRIVGVKIPLIVSLLSFVLLTVFESKFKEIFYSCKHCEQKQEIFTIMADF